MPDKGDCSLSELHEMMWQCGALASFSDTVERAERAGPMRPPLQELCNRRKIWAVLFVEPSPQNAEVGATDTRGLSSIA